MKAMEYMAFGLPLVCFDLQETRRIATAPRFFAAPADTESLARSIVALLDDAAARERLGSGGASRVRDELAWERQTPTYLAAIRPGRSSPVPVGHS